MSVAMEMMDRNDNVTAVNVATHNGVNNFAALKFRRHPMKTTWKDLSPTNKGSLTLGQIPCDNHVTLTRPMDTATSTMDGGYQLEQGPVIKLDSNIITTKMEERQVSTLPRRSRTRTKTWKDVSPTKEKKAMSSSYGGSPKTRKNEENTNQLVTWKDLSPTKEPSSPEKKNRKKKRPESGYFSNDVQSDVQESREGIDISLSESESGRGKSTGGSSPEDGCFNNEYFYDEDFIVQFDTNIRDGSVPRSEGEPDTMLPFPHSLTGSYTRFSNLPESQHDVFLGPYESELSGSRTSMEISSSEREMMCSSDMLEFSNDPLFTPTPTGEPVPQHFSVDSLGRSNDGRLAINCCPRKHEYFLSFNESQSRYTASESENSYISQSSSQGGASNSCSPSCSSNGEEAEEICSNSFHFCHIQNSNVQQRASRAYRPSTHQRGCSLGAVRERSIEKSELSDLEKGHCSKSSGSSRSHSCGSLRSPARSPSCYKLSSPCGTLRCLEDMHYSDEVNNTPQNPTYVTSWKHVNNLKKFGKLENMLDTSRCNSLPDLSHPVQTRKLERTKKQENLQAMADSFHNKRHSASLLEMYQRLRCQSNPVSPDTMKTVEQILFPSNGMFDDAFGDHLLSVSRTGLELDEISGHDSDICGCGNRGLRLNIPTEVGPGVIGSRDSRIMSPSFRSYQTGISPDTVVLWQGTKNFSSQFPPKTQDCGIQTSIDENKGPVLLDHSIQTSPSSPQKDITAILDDVCGRESRRELKEQCSPPPRRCVSANEIRAKSTQSVTNFRRSSSLSPSRIGKNSFYTHNSLPDLSFLASGIEHAHSNSSLFDPVQIPIILRPVIDDSQQTQSRTSCTCQGQKGHGQSRSGELASSSSGVSSSSSDPCYGEPRRCTSLAADLERILFLPPHLEGVPKAVVSKEQQTSLPQHHKDCQRGGAEHKFDRYTYEMHPGNCPGLPKSKPLQRRPLSSSSSSTSTNSLHLEGLYALKEEQSPTSPEKPETGPSWFEQQRIGNMHFRHFTAEELYYGLSDSQDDNDSITIEIFEQFSHDQKPLKSCLRKKDKGYRSRSLSNPDSLCAQGEADKPPKKPSRHSIACDGIFPQLVDEEHFENAEMECIRNFCDEGLPPPELLQEAPEVNLAEVVSSSSSSFEDANKKRVSFASEVSFHSPQYSPQCSPKKGPAQPPRLDTGDESLTLEITQSSQSTSVELVQKQVPVNTGPEKPPRAITTSRDFTPHPIGRSPSAEFAFEIARKRAVLIGVSQTAEALVTHFALARDPFDKLRLGSSAENPGISKLVVSQLCPAVEHVVEDGMKAFLTGFHVFGKIHITPWRVAEMSSEIGPYTRAVNELVKQLKLKQNLISNRQKFYAFIIGLLNLRLLDFWMGYIRSKQNIVDRVYTPSAILSLSQSHLQRGYDDMLLALQPLAVLPFQLEFDIVTPSSQIAVESSSPENKPGHNSLPRNYERHMAALSSAGKEVKHGNDSEKDPNFKPFENATFPRTRTPMTNMTTFKGGNSEKKSLLPLSPTRMPGSSPTSPESRPVRVIENNQVLDLKQEEKEEREERINVVQSPVTSITNLAAKFLQKTQSLDRGYRNGATEYSFVSGKQKRASLDFSQEAREGTQDGRHVVLDGRQSQESMSASTSQTMLQPKQSPRNSFNIISFFDKLLLPDKMNPRAPVATRSSWTEGQRSVQEPTVDTGSKSLSPQHQTQAVIEPAGPGTAEVKGSDEVKHIEQICEENKKELMDEERLGAGETMSEDLKSEDDITVETTESDATDCCQSLNNLGQEEKISEGTTCVRNIKDGSSSTQEMEHPGLCSAVPDVIKVNAVEADSLPSVLCEAAAASPAPNSTQAAIRRENRLEVGLGTNYPNVDINANSPDFHPDHYAIGVAMVTGPPYQSESDSQTACQPGQSESELQPACQPSCSESNLSEDNKSDCIDQSMKSQSESLHQNLKASDPASDSSGDSFHKTSYRYVTTLVSCDPDDNDHMTYEVGEYLEVLAQLDSDWLYCAKGKSEGLVRRGAVQPVTDDDMFEQLHDNFYR